MTRAVINTVAGMLLSAASSVSYIGSAQAQGVESLQLSPSLSAPSPEIPLEKPERPLISEPKEAAVVDAVDKALENHSAAPVVAATTDVPVASGERLATAMGHFARSRSLLIAALREFDEGQKKADASALLEVSAFRGSIINRAEELQKVLDPQPRSSHTGIKYQADSRLLGKGR